MIEIVSKIEVDTNKKLALVYTPGVAKSSMEIYEKPDRVFDLTNRSNSIGVISYNYEDSFKRAIFIKETYNIDAYPFEIKKTTKEDLDFVIKNIMPNFMGVDTALIEGKPYDSENTIPTQSRCCFFEGNIEDLEAIKLRELFGGVVETKIVEGKAFEKPVAIVSDGSAVLGLGNIGPLGALPVMEGKAVLFKELGDVNAISLCVETQNKDEIVKIVELLENSFSAINLEDICAPKCFEIESALIEKLAIPVFHDDQHGTAIVVSAGRLNALEIVNKKLEEIRIVISGAGAAGIAICKLLLKLGVENVILLNSKGIVYKNNPLNNPELEKMAAVTNKENLKGGLDVAIKGADVFIGVSAAGILTQDMVRDMALDAIVFALANPTPEIMPDLALKAGAKIAACGRSDFDNQINNSLAFPGLFRGVIDAKITKITDDIKIQAVFALAQTVQEDELDFDYIIPQALNKGVAKNISACIINYVRIPTSNIKA
jgi:malate dehydrogenase (oxaloacetate-decarboxylating)